MLFALKKLADVVTEIQLITVAQSEMELNSAKALNNLEIRHPLVQQKQRARPGNQMALNQQSLELSQSRHHMKL